MKYSGQWYNLLFLHTKSGANKTAYGLRQTMFSKIWKLRKALKDYSPSNEANFIALGDLNTMGNNSTVSGSAEIGKLETADL